MMFVCSCFAMGLIPAQWNNAMSSFAMVQWGKIALMHAAAIPGAGDVVKALISKGEEISAKDKVCCFQKMLCICSTVCWNM